MEFTTVSREIYPGYKLEMYYNPQEFFLPDNGLSNRFRLILIEEGTIMLNTDNGSLMLVSPAIGCINSKETLEICNSFDFKAKSIYFHPGVINNKFTLDLQHKNTEDMGVSDSQDIWCLVPFIKRDSMHNGFFSIDAYTAQHISFLMDKLGAELAMRRDDSWPCRSRTYLMELIFILSRAYNEPHGYEKVAMVNTSSEIHDIIIYLYTNYSTKISISDLTKRFHINRTTLNDKFVKMTGLSVMTYLNNLRIQIACSMLRNTTLNISEIINRVGFIDDGHFSRIFHKFTKCSPSEYRKENCWMLHK